MPVRVLIVDDHAMVRQGLVSFLGHDPEIDVVGEAANGAQAVALATDLRPDVVLMDLMMPLSDGVSAIGAIRQDLPDTEVIALTSFLEDTLVNKAIQAGAIGYLLKDTEARELRRAIKAAAAGQLVLSRKAAAYLLHDVKTQPDLSPLTERELQVLRLMATGFSNKEIGQKLTVSAPTVKSHIGSIFAKVGVNSRTQAVLYALHTGLVSLDMLKGETKTK
jgi:two-component system, NarL family, response regulator LiaR